MIQKLPARAARENFDHICLYEEIQSKFDRNLPHLYVPLTLSIISAVDEKSRLYLQDNFNLFWRSVDFLFLSNEMLIAPLFYYLLNNLAVSADET